MNRWIIDRFEGETAVCEAQADGAMRTISRALLPAESREGDCLIELPGENFQIDEHETDERRKKMKAQMDSLFE